MSDGLVDDKEVQFCWLRPNVTQLAEALDSSETAIDVDDASDITTADTLLIDDEHMPVVSVSGNTVTVAQRDATVYSTPATHLDNTSVHVFRQRRFRLLQELNQQALDRFAGKITVGAFNYDSNDTLSAWILSDLTGGHGIADHQEGVTDNRYRFGTIYTRYPSQWSKPFYIGRGSVAMSGETFPLGDLVYSGTTYGMFYSGGNLWQDVDDRGALTSDPSDKGVTYKGTASQALYYVPQGSSGYSTFNPATNTIVNNNAGGDPDVQSFLVWDDKLLAIENDGTLHHAETAAGATTFTPYTLGGNNLVLQTQYDIKKLHAFYDGQRNPVPYVVTAGDVWALDVDTPRFYRIPDFESVHPYFGIASAVWRGELYVASGMDVLAFNGEVLRLSASLSRDDGLPFVYQGYIRDLVAGQNALYALVNGQDDGGDTYVSVHEWSGFGWHCIWAGLEDAAPVRAIVSAAAGDYTLHWGMSEDGEVFTQHLPVSFTNPRESIANGERQMGDFTNPDGSLVYHATYFLETGRFDANLKGYRKIAQGVELRVRSLAPDGYETIKVYYRIDDDTDWTQLGDDITAAGRYTLLFGPVDLNGFRIGLDFETIELRYEVVDAVPVLYEGETACIEAQVMSFHRRMNPALAFSLNLDLATEFHDASAAQQVADLTEIRTVGRFVSMTHGTRSFRVVQTGQSGPAKGGHDPGALFQITVIEIPEVLGVEEAS